MPSSGNAASQGLKNATPLSRPISKLATAAELKAR